MTDDIVERLEKFLAMEPGNMGSAYRYTWTKHLNELKLQLTRLRSLSTGRDSTIEECAKVADAWGRPGTNARRVGEQIASCIRSLSHQEREG